MAGKIFLTHQQRQFVLHYVRGVSGTDAALSVYDVKNRNTAAVIASENLRKPNIIYFINMLAPNGSILEESVRVIAEGMRATKGVKKLPDHRIRLRASAMGIKLLDEIHK